MFCLLLNPVVKCIKRFCKTGMDPHAAHAPHMCVCVCVCVCVFEVDRTTQFLQNGLLLVLHCKCNHCPIIPPIPLVPRLPGTGAASHCCQIKTWSSPHYTVSPKPVQAPSVWKSFSCAVLQPVPLASFKTNLKESNPTSLSNHSYMAIYKSSLTPPHCQTIPRWPSTDLAWG